MCDEQLEAGNIAVKKTRWRKSSCTVDWLEVDDRSSDVLAKTRERWGHSGSSWLTTDGWTASVCARLDRQQTFLSWTREWQEDDYDQLGNLLDPKLRKEKREEFEWVLKQKLFDYVHQSECAERQGRHYSLKWVLKNK